MLCPNCGTRTTTEHKFCRSCGMNLEPVSRALAAHLSHGGAAAAAAAREAERRAARRTAAGMLAGVFAVLFGVFLIVFMSGKGFRFIGAAAVLTGLAAALAAVRSPLRSAFGALVEPAPPAPDAPDNAAAPTGRLLHETTFEPVPSIAEPTTDLLGAEVKDRDARR